MGLTKKERLEIKSRRLKNKRLLKKYPFIRAVDWYANPIKGYDFTLLDDIPRGWKKTFGELICEDISNVLKKYNIKTFNTQQIKEKYGELRWYFSAPVSIYDEIENIIDAYSHCSRNICTICGKPDVPCIDIGWISPICKKCFDKKSSKYYKKTFDDFSKDIDSRMEDSYSFKIFRKDDETEVITVDISEYTNKIRKRYEKCSK